MPGTYLGEDENSEDRVGSSPDAGLCSCESNSEMSGADGISPG